MFKRIKVNKIKEIFKRLPKNLAENAFLTFLILVFLAFIIGGVVFYKYAILVKEIKPEVSEKPLPFNEKSFQEILQIWQDKERKFKEEELKEYFNPFKVD